MKIRTHAIRELDELNIPYTLAEQAHKAKNVEQAAVERGVPVDQVVKTLLVRRANRRHVIALVRGDQRLSLKKLARIVGDKALDMAPPEDVPRITGYQIGAVSPFGLRRHDVPVYVDHHILDRPRVGVSAGRHDAGIELATADLVRAVAGQVADITE
ncbi:MAG TPA: YbaK/EbsC family protein [Anaerolineae bacterium]|nr:YbaK/EbsC family protein [Anaerolineae bacterium]